MPSKLIFVFVLNLMGVDITDRQYLRYLNQARKSTRNYWTAMETKNNALNKATWIMEIYLITTSKQWTEDVCETSRNLTHKQIRIWKELSYENMNNCLSQSFNNDWSWCEKKHHFILKNGKHLSNYIFVLVVILKKLSQK